MFHSCSARGRVCDRLLLQAIHWNRFRKAQFRKELILSRSCWRRDYQNNNLLLVSCSVFVSTILLLKKRKSFYGVYKCSEYRVSDLALKRINTLLFIFMAGYRVITSTMPANLWPGQQLSSTRRGYTNRITGGLFQPPPHPCAAILALREESLSFVLLLPDNPMPFNDLTPGRKDCWWSRHRLRTASRSNKVVFLES